MKTTTKNKLAFLGGFGVYFVALWLLWNTPIVYPLKIFVVMLHEISHGLVAVLTGGTIEWISLDPAQGGLCDCPGGNAFLTFSAGYLGSLAWGVLLFTAAESRRISSRFVITAIGALVLLLTALYVRSGFGLLFGLAFGTTLMVAGRRLGPTMSRIVLTVLGLTSCLYAILDIKSDILDRPHLESDAAMLAELTGVPTLVWGGLWILIALAVSALVFLRAYRSA